MRIKIVLYVSLLCLFSAPFAFGLAAYIPLPQKVAESDLIARVTILSTQKLKSTKRFRSIAKVMVTEAIKGVSVGQIFDLEYDNGLVCPNVLYSKNEDILIFGVKMDNGHYYTYNTYNGKTKVKTDVKENVISSLNVSGRALGSDNELTLDKVIQEIRKYINKESSELMDVPDKS